MFTYEVVLPGKSALMLDARPALTISSDGNTIVFSATEDGVTRLYVHRKNDAEPHVLPGTEGGSDPAFSPDDKWLAFTTRANLMKMSLDGEPTSLARLSDPLGIAWLNDNEVVVASEPSAGLSIVPVDGDPARPVTTLDPMTDDRTHRWPAVVPGGKAVLFTVGKISSPDNYDDARIDAVIVATGERHKVMEGASFVRVLTDGYLVCAKGGTVFVVPFDMDRLTTTGVPFPLIQGVATDTTTGAVQVAFAANDTLAYVSRDSSAIERRRVRVVMNWMEGLRRQQQTLR